ncbi:MAG: hypothetical protein ACRYFS_04940 [Janthinobacterium lividum]
MPQAQRLLNRQSCPCGRRGTTGPGKPSKQSIDRQHGSYQDSGCAHISNETRELREGRVNLAVCDYLAAMTIAARDKKQFLVFGTSVTG